MTTADRAHPLAVEDDDSYDPFEAFDAHFGAGKVASVYPVYAELRAECPVHPSGEFLERLGIDTTGLIATVPGKAVYTFRGVDQVLRDRDGFSVKAPYASRAELLGNTLLDMDEPEHMRVRRLIAEAFTPHAVETWRERLVVPIVQRFVDAFADR